jgi:menaquinone-dependent protoporphyrinogen oxidase
MCAGFCSQSAGFPASECVAGACSITRRESITEICYEGASIPVLTGNGTVANVLLLYSTVDGHTLEICRRLQAVVSEAGHDVTLIELMAESDPELDAFDRIVVGASIRYGKHRPEVAKFIEGNRSTLEAKSGAFFSVNAVARKPEKRTPETNPYVRKFLDNISWKPSLIGIFAGKIDYPRYAFIDKTMIRFIMWMTGGPTDPTGTFEFTDWNAVDEFGRQIAA